MYVCVIVCMYMRLVCSMYACMIVCMYMHVCMYVYYWLSSCLFKRAHAQMLLRACVSVHTCSLTLTASLKEHLFHMSRLEVASGYIYTSPCLYNDVCMYVYMYVFVFACVRVRMHTHTH
jgi:hypothetical protein